MVSGTKRRPAVELNCEKGTLGKALPKVSLEELSRYSSLIRSNGARMVRVTSAEFTPDTRRNALTCAARAGLIAAVAGSASAAVEAGVAFALASRL